MQKTNNTTVSTPQWIRKTIGKTTYEVSLHFRIIDLLPSREMDDVAKWLSSFPNLKIVSRGGSVSYNSSVKQTEEGIIQVSNRFHLLKGLTDVAMSVMTSLVAVNIRPPVPTSHYGGRETTDYLEKETPKKDFPTREHDAL